MGRTTSLTAFLSQWSSASRAGGPENLARTSVPALLLTYTADQSTFPSTRDAWLAAGGDRIRNVDIVGADHLPRRPRRPAERASPTRSRRSPRRYNACHDEQRRGLEVRAGIRAAELAVRRPIRPRARASAAAIRSSSPAAGSPA
jgi:hypothetical protein